MYSFKIYTVNEGVERRTLRLENHKNKNQLTKKHLLFNHHPVHLFQELMDMLQLRVYVLLLNKTNVS